MDRRSFLSLIAGATANQLTFAKSAAHQCLVLIELQGGNDGLNTIVPYVDKAYQKLRPKLALSTDSLVKIDDKVALHPSLAPLHDAWADSQFSIVQGLGYENPNRSHFRSHDIWISASDASERKESGWIADTLQGRGTAVQAVVFGNRAAVFQGGDANYISMRRTQEFLDAKLPELAPLSNTANPAQRHVHKVLKSTLAYRAKLKQSAEKISVAGKDDGGEFGDNLFGKQLQDAALLINAGLAPRVVTLHMRGFDTHANQLERHSARLSELAIALAAFRRELIKSNKWNDTLVVTWSEFGRRPAENASAGTDHGTAAPQLMLGGRVRGGLHGQQPSLTDLQNEDLVHALDFRQLYSSISTQWWGMRDSSIDTKRYPALNLLTTS